MYGAGNFEHRPFGYRFGYTHEQTGIAGSAGRAVWLAEGQASGRPASGHRVAYLKQTSPYFTLSWPQAI